MILAGSLVNAQIYTSGNLSTGVTTTNNTVAPAGYTWSELQGTNTTLGVSGYVSATSNFRLADDFTIPAGEKWAISSVEIFAYQTGSTAQPFNQMNLQILSAAPNASPSVLFGDTTTNIMNVAGTVDGLMYRTASATVGTTRRIWKVKGNVAITLNPGAYWLDYQVRATNSGNAFFPLVTNTGVVAEPGANAQQGSAGVYSPLVDTGSQSPQALPFIITYVATSLGTSETRQLDSRVVVYPNPTVSTFKLSLPSESLGTKTEVSVYDESGKKVKNFKVSESYNVSDLPKGIYIIKVNDGNNIKATKLIKN